MSDRLSFRVEEGLLDRLEALAQQRGGGTMSEVLREAVDAFCLPAALHERLRAIAQAQRVDVSELIRRAVAAYLYGPTAPVPAPPPPAVVGPMWPPRADDD